MRRQGREATAANNNEATSPVLRRHGQQLGMAEKTNVWRLFEALDQATFDELARYDDGVGTSANKYLAALGGAFGYGLKRNVIDLYKFVCRNYDGNAL